MSTMNITLASTLLYIQQQTIRSLYSIYLFFGILGCCLNIFLLSQRQFRTVSCCIYFIAASVTMVIHLTIGLGITMQAVDHVDSFYTISALCKIRIYGNQSTAMMFRWCLSIACLDRFALTSVHVRLRNFATIRVARRMIAIIIPLWLVLPIHTLIFYNVKGGICGILNNYPLALYHSLFTTIFGSVLPILVMISCTLLIHRNLLLKEQRRQKNIHGPVRDINSTLNTPQKRNQQVLMMLLAQVIVYTVLTAPLMIFYIYSVIALGIPNKPLDRLAIERFAQFASETINYLFPVLSFYLYTLVSRTFRDELIKIVRSGIKCRHSNNSNRIEPTQNGIIQERNIGHPFTKQPIAVVGSMERSRTDVNHQHMTIS